MNESAIRSAASIRVDQRLEPAPEAVVAAMVQFESRYGGLVYPLITRNGMECGLDGDTTAHQTDLGPAFTAILDGDWTWPVDVLLDGRTAMGPGRWSYRVIDKSVEQRLEKHALLAEVRRWPHRTIEVLTASGVPPEVSRLTLPPPVHEASGPADLWWTDGLIAVQLSLLGWPDDEDRWQLCQFASTAKLLSEALEPIQSTVQQTALPETWCGLCGAFRDPDDVCVPPAEDLTSGAHKEGRLG
jgi:hypothetical protein